jgi:hypothetical protein
MHLQPVQAQLPQACLPSLHQPALLHVPIAAAGAAAGYLEQPQLQAHLVQLPRASVLPHQAVLRAVALLLLQWQPQLELLLL